MDEVDVGDRQREVSGHDDTCGQQSVQQVRKRHALGWEVGAACQDCPNAKVTKEYGAQGPVSSTIAGGTSSDRAAS